MFASQQQRRRESEACGERQVKPPHHVTGQHEREAPHQGCRTHRWLLNILNSTRSTSLLFAGRDGCRTNSGALTCQCRTSGLVIAHFWHTCCRTPRGPWISEKTIG